MVCKFLGIAHVNYAYENMYDSRIYLLFSSIAPEVTSQPLPGKTVQETVQENPDQPHILPLDPEQNSEIYSTFNFVYYYC